jgi:hypothetical protein
MLPSDERTFASRTKSKEQMSWIWRNSSISLAGMLGCTGTATHVWRAARSYVPYARGNLAYQTGPSSESLVGGGLQFRWMDAVRWLRSTAILLTVPSIHTRKRLLPSTDHVHEESARDSARLTLEGGGGETLHRPTSCAGVCPSMVALNIEGYVLSVSGKR